MYHEQAFNNAKAKINKNKKGAKFRALKCFI